MTKSLQYSDTVRNRSTAQGLWLGPKDGILVKTQTRRKGVDPYPQMSLPKPASKLLAQRDYAVILVTHRASPYAREKLSSLVPRCRLEL